jgi:AcrR family transcriptional regulator
MPARPAGADRRRPGRPSKLSREAIFDAAEALGLHFGVSEGAIYRHVRGMDEVVDGAGSRILCRIDTDLPEASTWPAYLEGICTQLRRHALRAPGFGRWLVAGSYDEPALDVFDRILDGITRRDPELDRDTAYLVGSQAVACTMGLVTSDFVGAVPGEPTDDDLDDQFRWMLRSLLRGMAAHLAEGAPLPRRRALRDR